MNSKTSQFSLIDHNRALGWCTAVVRPAKRLRQTTLPCLQYSNIAPQKGLSADLTFEQVGIANDEDNIDG